MSNTAERFRKLVAEHVGLEIERVVDDASLVDDLGCDSLDIVEIVMASEEEFGVCISDDEADKANTVREAINIIDAKLPEVAA
ncbi:MAG: putative acyl carrier protein [Prokaryotic dsDNA virus sp.]|nr:acyl carrier protein [Pseudomonas sp.]MBS67349.1 acyl carrier protein [Pseudomonas sp.]QDP55214.1 MAG: putative acyl carrier protein [Prokaryotic dsDNA virus sp.]